MNIVKQAENLYIVDDKKAIKNYVRQDADYWIRFNTVPTLEQVVEDMLDNEDFVAQPYEDAIRNKKDWLEMISVYDMAKTVQNIVSYSVSDLDESKRGVKKMKLKIRENYDHEATYYVESYYDGDFRGLEDDLNTDDFSEAFDWIWEKLNKGGFVWITDNVSGQNVKLALPEDNEYYDYIDPNDCIIWSSKYGENIDLNTDLYELLQ